MTDWTRMDREEAIAHAKACIAELEESLHYCKGTANLAMKHRDEAEAHMATLEVDIEKEKSEYDHLKKTLEDVASFASRMDKVREKAEADNAWLRAALEAFRAWVLSSGCRAGDDYLNEEDGREDGLNGWHDLEAIDKSARQALSSGGSGIEDVVKAAREVLAASQKPVVGAVVDFTRLQKALNRLEPGDG